MSFTSDVANATVRDEIVDGKQNVNNGGVTIGNTVVSGGSVNVNSGGTVIDGVVEAGGKMTISSGGVVSGLSVDMPDSSAIALNGGTIYDLTYNGLPGAASFMQVTGGVIDGGIITGGCIQLQSSFFFLPSVHDRGGCGSGGGHIGSSLVVRQRGESDG